MREDREVGVEWMTMAEAQEAGADAFFDEKYGERVRTIRVAGFSHELCGGTHCRASGQIGGFIITGERSIGSGMRRIEAVTGAAADRLMEERFGLVERTVAAVGARGPESVEERITALQEELRDTKRRLRAGAAGAVAPSPRRSPRRRRTSRPVSRSWARSWISSPSTCSRASRRTSAARCRAA